MSFDAEFHQRRSLRMRGWDYSSPGFYFVTVCSQNSDCVFGEIADGEMISNDAGNMIRKYWLKIPEKFGHTCIDEFVLMPNHIHGIIRIMEAVQVPCKTDRRTMLVGAAPCGRPLTGEDEKDSRRGRAPALGDILNWFKTMTTNEYLRKVREEVWPPCEKRLWQRNYYEHVVRGKKELAEIRRYILDNPKSWTNDPDHPNNIP